MPDSGSRDIEHDANWNSYQPISNPLNIKPAYVSKEQYHRLSKTPIFLTKPLLGSLVLDNQQSDARDHCANERTFLSWLRLSMYLSIVACAIILSFHLRSAPTSLERQYALPLGLVFWVLSLASLCSGFANYVMTLTKYSRHTALVQSGWKTHLVFSIVAFAIIGTCILFLSTNKR
ncbi:hypothetical protein FQN57_004162 [Myotisia sp. PD_48]|nr:hypothetical protein FQN57_004162 [Myotisia sp. PD_48]